MRSQYPILDNRPIDQWKVTELKEELRRRKLTTKGLKEDLVRRLDEALRVESELVKEKELNSRVDPEPVPKEIESNSRVDPVPVPKEKLEEVHPTSREVAQIEENANAAVADDERETFVSEETVVDADHITQAARQQTEVQIESVGNAVSEQGAEIPNELIDNAVLDGTVEETVTTGAATEENISDKDLSSKSEANGEDFMDDMENQEPKPPTEDTTSHSSEPEKQVSEVSPDLGFQVKCDSISTDSVTINEKIELKDNLNANNFHLELDVGREEMVQPSSTDIAPVAGDFHQLDHDQEPEDNHGSVEEMDNVTHAASLDITNKIDNSNGGSPEKLNLDRSSGDESMEEDVLETKQHEPTTNSEVVDAKVRELHVVKEGSPAHAVVGGHSPDKKDVVAEEDKSVFTAEKRKLEDQGSSGTTEPVKRQRRWNAETIKVPEAQASNQTSSTTPKDIFQTTPRRIFTRTDSSLSVESPKERFVPPSQKTATTSLRIDRFLRPFTLKAVQELLAKTGTVCSFWMDHIKTHCFVTYSSVEEAVATRNALYNLQWPPNGGRLLTADFVDPQEVKAHVEAPPSPAAAGPSPTPQPSTPSLPNASQVPPQSGNRQQLHSPSLPQPPPALQPPPVKEKESLPPPPPPPKKPEPPILTLDDLFKKTRATPRIYYLPLSEEQVEAKRAAQGRGTRA